MNWELAGYFAQGQRYESVVVVNPAADGTDAEIFTIFDIEDDGKDTIITVERDGETMFVPEFLTRLSYQEMAGIVRVHVDNWEGQKVAFFAVDTVEHTVAGFRVILGEWLYGVDEADEYIKWQ